MLYNRLAMATPYESEVRVEEYFPRRLKVLRMMKGLSLTGLQGESGISADTINKIELGRRQPHPGTVKKLADALGVEVRELFEDPVVPPKAQSRPSPEPAKDSDEGGLRSVEREAWRSYAFDRAAHWESIATRDDVPLFRDLSAAILWYAEVEREGYMLLAALEAPMERLMEEIKAKRLSLEAGMPELNKLAECFEVIYAAATKARRRLDEAIESGVQETAIGQRELDEAMQEADRLAMERSAMKLPSL